MIESDRARNGWVTVTVSSKFSLIINLSIQNVRLRLTPLSPRGHYLFFVINENTRFTKLHFVQRISTFFSNFFSMLNKSKSAGVLCYMQLWWTVLCSAWNHTEGADCPFTGAVCLILCLYNILWWMLQRIGCSNNSISSRKRSSTLQLLKLIQVCQVIKEVLPNSVCRGHTEAWAACSCRNIHDTCDENGFANLVKEDMQQHTCNYSTDGNDNVA